VGKKEYLNKLREAHADAVCVFDVGEKMLAVAEDLNINTSTEKILDAPESTQTALRSTVFEQVLRLIEQEASDKHIVLGLHASFRWKKVLSLGFNAYYLKKITERAAQKGIGIVYVCFTDTICKIYARLQKREQWRDKLDLEEILLWSNEEAALTKMIAEYERAEFVLLPSEEPLETLWNILNHPNKKKLYLSFPITVIKNVHPGLLVEVGEFRDQLRKHFVVFDPLAVKDIEWIKGEYDPPPDLNGELRDVLRGLTEKAKSYMESQTVTRDFQLVDQSDFVVVYYKTDRVSFGVVSEMIHGFTHNKPVYAIWEGSISPFFSNYCTGWKSETGSLVDLLVRKYET
jgi:adenylate kinase